MGTRIHVLLEGDPELLAVAARGVQRLDLLWSRFRPDSEVSKVNAAGGEPVAVSHDTLELFELSDRAHRETGGLFDPTLLNEVVAAGYDRDFELVKAEGGGPAASVPERPPLDGSGIEVDREAGTVTLAAGLGFDSGGLGKGLAAQMIAEHVIAEGADAVLVNLGGDLYAAGEAPADGWSVGLDNPFVTNGAAAARVVLRAGALATSTSHTRNWLQDGELRHHIIDPRTGEPSQTDVASASVICDDGWRAEALAKAVMLAGVELGGELLAGEDATGLMIAEHGEMIPAAGLDALLDGSSADFPNLRAQRRLSVRLPATAGRR